MSHDLSRWLGSNSRTSEVALVDSTTGQPLWTTVHPAANNRHSRGQLLSR